MHGGGILKAGTIISSGTCWKKIYLKKINRCVLHQDGIFALIFKRKIDNWNLFSQKTGLGVYVLDDSEGRV